MSKRRRDVDVFVEILRHQINEEDYERITPSVEERGAGIHVILADDEVGFVFDQTTGRVMYCYNWKE